MKRNQAVKNCAIVSVRKALCGALAFLCLAIVGSNGAQGEIISLTTEYTFGGTPPAGTSDWLTAVFDDEAHPGHVD